MKVLNPKFGYASTLTQQSTVTYSLRWWLTYMYIYIYSLLICIYLITTMQGKYVQVFLNEIFVKKLNPWGQAYLAECHTGFRGNLAPIIYVDVEAEAACQILHMKLLADSICIQKWYCSPHQRGLTWTQQEASHPTAINNEGIKWSVIWPCRECCDPDRQILGSSFRAKNYKHQIQQHKHLRTKC